MFGEVERYGGNETYLYRVMRANNIYSMFFKSSNIFDFGSGLRNCI